MDDPIISTFPSRDRRFARDAEAVLAHLRTREPDELQRRLRDWYPACTVRRRDDLATIGGPDRWYVFREARWRMSHDREDRLFAAMAQSRDVVAATLHAIDGAAETLTRLSGQSAPKSWAAEMHRRFEREPGANSDRARPVGEPT